MSTRWRFAAAYLALGAVVGTGIGALIVLLERPAPTPPPPWSSWRPSSSSTATEVEQIAQHVGTAYILPSGKQLVAVRVGGLQQNSNFGGVAVVKKDDSQSVDHQYGNNDTVVFALCGATKTCAIGEGKPSVARGNVVRREALELALYTFEYAHPIKNILIFFPPLPGQKQPSSTLFFRRDDLSSSLHHPLRKTLPQVHPPLPGQIKPGELKTVKALTDTAIYTYLGISQNVIVIQPAA
jgi:hypothetical protein